MNQAVRRLMPILTSSRILPRTVVGLHQGGISSVGRSVATSSAENTNNNEVATKCIIDSVNSIIESKNVGQTFAVVHFYSQQYLVHLGDIICVEKAVPVELGERIKLEKCLLIGGADFSLIGRPLLNRDLVQVEATVIEKTMSQTFFNMEHKPRSHGYRRYRFQRNPQTMFRISEIKICHPLNASQERIN